jgi:hypothetical protein
MPTASPLNLLRRLAVAAFALSLLTAPTLAADKAAIREVRDQAALRGMLHSTAREIYDLLPQEQEPVKRDVPVPRCRFCSASVGGVPKQRFPLHYVWTGNHRKTRWAIRLFCLN